MDCLAATGRIGLYEKEYIPQRRHAAIMLFVGRDLGDAFSELCIDITDLKTTETPRHHKYDHHPTTDRQGPVVHAREVRSCSAKGETGQNMGWRRGGHQRRVQSRALAARSSLLPSQVTRVRPVQRRWRQNRIIMIIESFRCVFRLRLTVSRTRISSS
jgi:hypothetical protein